MKSQLAGRLAREIARVSCVLALADGDDFLQAKIAELNEGRSDNFGHELIETACLAVASGEQDVQVRALKLLEQFEHHMANASDNRPKSDVEDDREAAVWDWTGFCLQLERDGYMITRRQDLKTPLEQLPFMGLPVKVDPTLPEGVIELRQKGQVVRVINIGKDEDDGGL